MKKSFCLVVFLTTPFIFSMDQDPQSSQSIPQPSRLAPEPSANMLNTRRSSSSSFNPVVRIQKQSSEHLPTYVNTVNIAEIVKRRSVGSAQPVNDMDLATAVKIFDDKRGRSIDKK